MKLFVLRKVKSKKFTSLKTARVIYLYILEINFNIFVKFCIYIYNFCIFKHRGVTQKNFDFTYRKYNQSLDYSPLKKIGHEVAIDNLDLEKNYFDHGPNTCLESGLKIIFIH